MDGPPILTTPDSVNTEQETLEESNSVVAKHEDVEATLDYNIKLEIPYVDISDNNIKVKSETAEVEKVYIKDEVDSNFRDEITSVVRQSYSTKKLKIDHNSKDQDTETVHQKSSKRNILKKPSESLTATRHFRCAECGYSCVTTSKIGRHLKTHTGEKSYVCPLCDDRYAQSAHLNDHLQTHTQETLVKCDLCDYRTFLSSDLEKHLIIQHALQPFACNECRYTTYQSYEFKVHLKVHSGVQMFECRQCNCKFARKSYLIRHMLTRHHTEELLINIYPDYRGTQIKYGNEYLKSHSEYNDDLFSSDNESNFV